MRSIFITGIGGFIGKRLGERALASGWSVTGVDLSIESVAGARRIGLDALVGDVTNAARMRELVANVDVVVHTAALVRESGSMDVFRRINVGGSVAVATAARDAGVRTFVQLSSVMVYGFTYPENVTEAGPMRGEGNPYCQTKIESEAAVLALGEPRKLGVIVIRPGDVYGPGSVPWIARPIQMMRRGLLVVPSGGGVINHVYVDNLVDGIFLAVEREAHGSIFNVTDGVAVTFERYFALLAARAGSKPPRTLPAPLLLGAASVVGAMHACGITKTEASAQTIRYLMRPHAYSIDKARRELGYSPRIGLDAGLSLTQSFIDDCVANDRAPARVPHRRRSSSPRHKSIAELRERSEPAEGGGGAVAKRAAGARPPDS